MEYIDGWHDIDMCGTWNDDQKWTDEKWQKLGPFGRWSKKHSDPTMHRSLHQHFGHIQWFLIGSLDQFEWSFSSITAHHYSMVVIKRRTHLIVEPFLSPSKATQHRSFVLLCKIPRKILQYIESWLLLLYLYINFKKIITQWYNIKFNYIY